MSIRLRSFFYNALIPASAGILIFIYIYYGRFGTVPSLYRLPLLYGVSVFAGAGVGILMSLFDNYFKKYWDRQLQIAYFLTLQLSLKFLSALIIVFLISFGYLLMTTSFAIADIWSVYYDEIIKILLLTSGTMLVYGLISFTFQSYNYYAHHRIERMKQERKQLELQFDALKNQLSPHYLFNCLNTISSLVHKSASQTEDFIRRMAKTFQYVLTNDRKELVTLAEEIDFVKAYNYLLKVRFENQLILDINVEREVLTTSIPPLTLQMLLENAVKHNVIDNDNAIKVRIYNIGRELITVENTKTRKPTSQESFNIGLENIRKRYSHLCGREIKINDADKFSVSLPLIEGEVAYE